MAIRPSPAKDLPRLIAELSSDDTLRRESAAARLIIMGSPATMKLAQLASTASANAEARRTALRTLGAIDAARATRVALAVVAAADEVVALEAVAMLGTAAESRDAQSTEAFERLTELALDTGRPVSRRLAALAALEPLPHRLMQPVYDALAHDPAPQVAARIAHGAAGSARREDDVAAVALDNNSPLEAVAAAWLAAAGRDQRRREELAAVFAAIVTREGMTRQHPTLKTILRRFPAAAVLVASAPKTPRRRPRPTR